MRNEVEQKMIYERFIANVIGCLNFSRRVYPLVLLLITFASCSDKNDKVIEKANCVSGQCVLAADGTYQSIAECKAKCGDTTNNTLWDCVSGKCETSVNGKYSTLESCEQACFSGTPGYTCVDGSCIYAASGGEYKTLEECVLACETNYSSCGSDTVVVGLDGKTYRIVQIGAQCWFAENLRFTPTGCAQYSFATGPPNSSGVASHIKYWYLYNNDTSYRKYGILYNWLTVDQCNLCPMGWRVPTKNDFVVLVNHLGGEENAGSKLKSLGFGWDANNESGFNARPYGYLANSGKFHGGHFSGNTIGGAASFWSTTLGPTGEAYSLYLNGSESNAILLEAPRASGMHCRCIKE